MYTFKSTKNPDNRFDIADVEFEIETADRAELLEQFGYFLKACGYHFEGHLEIIEDEA